MSVSLHATTQLPLPVQPVSSGRARSIELWLLTAFLFSLLIVGRLTAHNPASTRLRQLPASTMLLHHITPPAAPSKSDGPVPLFQPTAFHLLVLAPTAK
ncbi:hypothetical protein [Hymenobacter norwichensis]|uniref:hypothetical protein n=1 Tax=Hymenobacter norwichensis TaxID=223903 RepID=UPI0012FCB19E|nr:hypothetical protein [Hymenobacter norwichensis]